MLHLMETSHLGQEVRSPRQPHQLPVLSSLLIGERPYFRLCRRACAVGRPRSRGALSRASPRGVSAGAPGRAGREARCTERGRWSELPRWSWSWSLVGREGSGSSHPVRAPRMSRKQWPRCAKAVARACCAGSPPWCCVPPSWGW